MVWLCLCLWCVVGLLGFTYEMRTVSVLEGDEVTLHTDRELRNDDLIVWRFGPEDSLITQIRVTDSRVLEHDDYDDRFRGRIMVDHQTGCLTITRTTAEHAGRYELLTSRVKKFFVLIVYGASGAEGETQSVSVMEGDAVSLHTDAGVRDDGLMTWSFGNSLLADSVTVNDDVLDGRFRDRLKVDDETGSLTISKTTTKHTGLYHLQTKQKKKIFILSVDAPLPAPVIFSFCPESLSSSESTRVLLCSAVKVSHVTLSWFKGSALLSSISESDLSISLSLALEVGYQDTNTYSCVLNGSLGERTRHLDLSQLRTCSDSVQACDPVEPVMRLVVTALVGVAAAAAVVVLLYDIRSRRAEQEQTPDQ